MREAIGMDARTFAAFYTRYLARCELDGVKPSGPEVVRALLATLRAGLSKSPPTARGPIPSRLRH
jgi:hypothetical protein